MHASEPRVAAPLSFPLAGLLLLCKASPPDASLCSAPLCQILIACKGLVCRVASIGPRRRHVCGQFAQRFSTVPGSNPHVPANDESIHMIRHRPPNASSVQLAHLHRIENVPDVTHHSFCELQRVAFRDGFSGTCHINGLHAAPLTKKQVPTEVLPSRVGM